MVICVVVPPELVTEVNAVNVSDERLAPQGTLRRRGRGEEPEEAGAALPGARVRP